MEIAVALLFLLFGGVVSWDSYRLGASWGSDGPQAGYFPFYIGAHHHRVQPGHARPGCAHERGEELPFVLRGS